ncbi:MAG: hypothetical protein KGI56_03550 [Acidobacteriota bacterium]|nr:hypothetical protein [Acidobacteriota bacterium]
MKQVAWFFGCCLAVPLAAQGLAPGVPTGPPSSSVFPILTLPVTPIAGRPGAPLASDSGTEYRSEPLKGLVMTTTFSHPWARFNVGYAFPAPLLRPFIGVEAVVPLAFQGGDYGWAADVLKRVPPQGQVGLYGGIRF